MIHLVHPTDSSSFFIRVMSRSLEIMALRGFLALATLRNTCIFFFMILNNPFSLSLFLSFFLLCHFKRNDRGSPQRHFFCWSFAFKNICYFYRSSLSLGYLFLEPFAQNFQVIYSLLSLAILTLGASCER